MELLADLEVNDARVEHGTGVRAAGSRTVMCVTARRRHDNRPWPKTLVCAPARVYSIARACARVSGLRAQKLRKTTT